MKVCQVKQKWKIIKERTPFTTDTAKFSEGRIRWSYGVSWWFQCTTPAFRRTFQNNYSQLPSILVFILFFWEEQLKKYALFSGGSREGARGPAPSLFLDQTEVRRAEKIVVGDHPLLSYLKVWVRHCYLKNHLCNEIKVMIIENRYKITRESHEQTWPTVQNHWP